MQHIYCFDDLNYITKLEERIHVLNVICGFEKDPNLQRQVCCIQKQYRRRFETKKKHATRIQARIRGWILRYDKYIFDKSLKIIQTQAKYFLQEKRKHNAALYIQKVFRKYKIISYFHPLLMNYKKVCQKNLYLSNIILKLITKLDVQENVSYSSLTVVD